jgi:hypothetical protein
MDIDFLAISRYRFPGRAGELQTANATASLIAELGDNYPTYHAAIVAAFKDAGGIPPATGNLKEMESYCRQMATIQSLVAAEMGLRRAYQLRQRLPELPDHGIPGPPVIDELGAMTAASDTTETPSPNAAAQSLPG